MPKLESGAALAFVRMHPWHALALVTDPVDVHLARIEAMVRDMNNPRAPRSEAEAWAMTMALYRCVQEIDRAAKLLLSLPA